MPQKPPGSQELAIALTFTAGEHGGLICEVEDLSRGISDVAQGIDDAARRVTDIAERLGLPARERALVNAVREQVNIPAPSTWDEVVARATDVLGDRTFELDPLIDEKQRASIERRFSTGFTIRSRLDRYDVLAAVAAGVTAALVDHLLVAVPRESSLTKALRSLAIDSDNWMAGLAKVPFDRVTGVDLEGMYPQTHRVQTFGHDPLLGWIYGTMDILRGTLAGVGGGAMKTLDIGDAPTDNVAVALGLEAMHLLSDIVTSTGLPLPGWTALLIIDHRLPGARHSVADLSRWMYVKGYDTWHAPSLAAPLLAIEVVTRGYLALRQAFDPAYRDELDTERLRIGSERVGELPRYELMTLIARSVAAAGNAGRFALSGANPLNLNVAIWMGFAKSLVGCLDRASLVTAAIDTAHTNRLILDAGWVSFGIDKDDLPEIHVPDQ